MKDISIYFSNFAEKNTFKKNQIGSYIKPCEAADFGALKPQSIALFFVPEYRNSTIKADDNWVHTLRTQLYNHFKGNWHVNLYDLGIIQPGNTVEDTYGAVKEVCAELIKNDILPFVIGGSQDLTFPVYQAYEKLEQTINILDVDAALDLGEIETPINARAWINKIILHKPNYLFNYSLFGYQTYLVDPDEINLLDKLYFDTLRLGDFYMDDKKAEPLLRNADLMTFDMNAVRSSDYKNNNRDLPNGLYGEDACRIMRYAGISDKLTSVGLFNISNTKPGLESDLNLISQMIWYFIEGYSLRKKDFPIGSKKNYIRYIVSIDDFKDEVVFYKSDKSSRWWMEVPYPKIEGVKYQRHLLVPCNYSDYENALQNELPDLWLSTYKKLS